MKYADLRDKYSFEEVSDLFLKNGFDKGQIMQNEYAYKQSHGMAPEKKTSSFQDWMLKHENVSMEELGNSIIQSAEGYKRAVNEGFNESNTGIIVRGKLPEEGSADFTTGQKIIKGVTGVVSDSGFYAAGGALGGFASGGNPIGASAGAFGLHSYARSVLMTLYKDGEINNFGELMDRMDEFGAMDMLRATGEGAKGVVEGAVVGKAGQIANKFSNQIINALGLEGMKANSVRVANELATTTPALVGANSLLNMQVPTKDDFTEAAGVLLGLKGVHYIQNRYLPKLPKTENKPANDDFMADIDNTLNELKVTYNPNWQQKVIKDSGSRITYTVDNKEISQLQGDISGWLMDYYAKTGIGPREAVIEVKNNPAKIAEIAGYNQDQQAVIDAKVKEKLPWFGETDKLTEEQIAEIEKATQEVREEMNAEKEWEETFGDYSVEDVKKDVIVGDDMKEAYQKKIDSGMSEKQAILKTNEEFIEKDSSRLNTEDTLPKEDKGFESLDGNTYYIKPYGGEGSKLNEVIYYDKDGNKRYLFANVSREEAEDYLQYHEKLLKEELGEVNNTADKKALQEARIEGEKLYSKDFEKIDLKNQTDYTEYANNPEGAIEKLITEKNGYVSNAMYKEGIGNIDFIYGKGGKNGYGLAHILERRTQQKINALDFVKSIPEIIRNGSPYILIGQDGRKYIIFNDKEAIIRLDLDGEKRNWLLTAYMKRSKGLPTPQTLGQNYEDYRTVSNPDLTSNTRNGEKSPSAENNITPKDENVKYNELNDEVQDLAYEGETPKNGLVKSDIYLGDKSMINVSYSGDIKTKPISKTDIADNFKKRFDVAYKKGKMYKKGSVRGFYKPHQEVIRTRGYDDFPVLVHETAHHLDKILFKGNQTLTKDERKIYAKEFKGIASVGDTFEEGFAEFVSYYVTNPEYVRKETPKFYKHFQEFMKENEPAILEVLDGAQKDWQAWREQPSDARIRGQVSYKMRDAGISFPKMAHDFYTNYVDDLHPLKMLEKEALRARRKRNPKADMELKPSQSPYVLARLHRGVANKVANYIEKKAFNTRLEETGDSYKDVFGGLTREELDEFNLYLISRRAMDLNLRGIETGIGQKDAVITTKNLIGKWGERAEKVYKYSDGLLRYAVDSGLISEEAYIKMRQLDPHYVPFQREFPIDDRPTARRLSPNQVVKRIKGSDRRIIPVYESILKETANIIANADKNVIMQKIAALAEMEGSGKYIERVESKKKVELPQGTWLAKPQEDNVVRANTVEITDPQTGNIITLAEMSDEFWVRKAADKKTEITVMRGGEPYVYEVSPEFANIVNGLTPQDINVLWKVLSAPASTLRAGATLTPEFMIKNAIRDNLEAFINSKGLFIPFVSQAKGGYHLMRSDKELRDWQNAGGSLANFIPRDRASLQKRIKKINKNYDLVRSTGYVGAAWNQIKNVNPMNLARLLSEAVEDSTRLGAYGVNKKYYNKKGYGEYDAKLGAALQSREATLDFARIGAKVRGLNAIIPFLNAGIQGSDKMARNIVNHPIKTVAAFTPLLLATTYFFYANEDDKDIKDLNKTIKDTNWVTKIDGKMVKIPKPQNAIPFLTMYEHALESTPDEWWTKAKGGMADYLELNVWSSVPAALQPIVEKERNKTSYLGINLIPAEVENLMPEYQYTGATSETGKKVSKILANLGISNSYTSPIVIDQFVRDWTGGTGQYVLNALDYVGTGKEKEDIYDYEHTPLFKAFRIAYPTRGNSQSYKDFMEKSEKLIKQYDTGKYLLKKDPQDMSYAFAQKYGFIKKYRATIVDLGKMLKAIQDNKGTSVQEKRQNADNINMRIIDLSKQGLTLIDTLGE